MTAAILQAGSNLCDKDWLEIRKRAIFDFCKWDIQCGDHSVLAQFPLLLEPATASFLDAAAEALSKEALEAEAEILRRPELLGQLGLPRPVRRVLQENVSSPAAIPEVRVMRFDFHPTPDGWRISEVNADVPGGFVEASGWNSLFAAKWPGAMAPPSPSEAYARAILAEVGADALVGFVHATAYSDDRQVMRHLAHCFSRHGLRTCLLSPAHLRWIAGSAEICAAFASGNAGAIVRFFPAEWLPNLPAEQDWKSYFQVTRTPISNPASAIVLQTKRLPLVWNELCTDLFTWRRLLPESREPAEFNDALDESWVLKPALGRVGESVGICGITPDADFQVIAKEARLRSDKWIAQRRFAILQLITESGPKYPCIGVFTIGGKAAGYYGRIADTPIINQNAQDVAVLVNCAPEGRAI